MAIPIMHDTHSLIMKAGEAFGSGGHPSTQGALLAMRSLQERAVGSVLDMGCGSGVLAVAAARFWRCPVLAVDIAEAAVALTRENAETNEVASWVTALRSDGYGHAAIAARAPYDLVVANLLPEPLIRFSRDLARVQEKGGVAILSGILVWRAEQVIEAHAAQGYALGQCFNVGDWRTLLMRKAQ